MFSVITSRTHNYRFTSIEKLNSFLDRDENLREIIHTYDMYEEINKGFHYVFSDEFGTPHITITSNIDIFDNFEDNTTQERENMGYTLTNDEVQAVEFARGRYVWADIVHANLIDNTLTLDNMTQHEMLRAIRSWGGIPLLNPRCDLYSFLLYLEPV
jgi:hypothetical protein